MRLCHALLLSSLSSTDESSASFLSHVACCLCLQARAVTWLMPDLRPCQFVLRETHGASPMPGPGQVKVRGVGRNHRSGVGPTDYFRRRFLNPRPCDVGVAFAFCSGWAMESAGVGTGVTVRRHWVCRAIPKHIFGVPVFDHTLHFPDGRMLHQHSPFHKKTSFR